MTISQRTIFGGILLLAAAFMLPAQVTAWGGGYYPSGYSNTDGGGQGFFFPYGTEPGAPREQLVVYGFGPTASTGGWGGYQPSYTYTPPFYSAYQQPTYNYAPQYQTHYQYIPQQPMYYPQYTNSYSYSSYSTGPSFGPAYPTGDHDMFGTPLCQWYDYSGATPCAYDPHQWIHDPYTGTWY